MADIFFGRIETESLCDREWHDGRVFLAKHHDLPGLQRPS
jgi:hypothetical protein